MTELRLREPKLRGEALIAIYPEEEYTAPYDGGVPEAFMDEIKDIVGDAQARVAVTTDVGTKHFGNGVSASFTVSFSCNQDGATVARAAEIASRWANQMARQHVLLAENEYLKLKAERGWQ